MDNAITVLWLLGVGVYLGTKLREAVAHKPQAHAVSVEPPRVSQALCRCADCQAPFWQESPAEVQ